MRSAAFLFVQVYFISAILQSLYRLSFWNKMNLISAYYKGISDHRFLLHNLSRDGSGDILEALTYFEDLVFYKRSVTQLWWKCTYLLPVYTAVQPRRQPLTLRMAVQQSVASQSRTSSIQAIAFICPISQTSHMWY